MNTTCPIAAVGELIGEPARAAILIALLDGKAHIADHIDLRRNLRRARSARPKTLGRIKYERLYSKLTRNRLTMASARPYR